MRWKQQYQIEYKDGGCQKLILRYFFQRVLLAIICIVTSCTIYLRSRLYHHFLLSTTIMSPTTKSALILIANGTEETEFTTVYDLLVRAGISVQSASVGVDETQSFVVCSRGMKIVPDSRFEDLSEEIQSSFNILLIPGGLPGAKTLSTTSSVLSLVRSYAANGEKFLAMICAGPLVALESKLWDDRRTWVEGKIRLTSHPSVKDKLEEKFAYVEEDVVVHHNLITSRGPGTAILWSLEIIKTLLGASKAEEVRGPLVMPST